MLKQLLVLTSAILGGVFGYSSGAPSCNYPDPQMMGTGTSTSGSYVIYFQDLSTKQNITHYAKGQRVQVVLTGPRMFKGFLIISVNEGSQIFQNYRGQFTQRSSTQLELSCSDSAPKSGITQNNDRAMMPDATETFTWTAPSDASASVRFYAIVVETRTTWYGNTASLYSTLVFNSTAPLRTYTDPIEPVQTNPPDNRKSGTEREPRFLWLGSILGGLLLLIAGLMSVW